MTIHPGSQTWEVEAAFSGDRPAPANTTFLSLFRGHVRQLYAYLLLHTGDEPAAQNLLARTFLAARENGSIYGGEQPFTIHLFAVARQQVADLGPAHLLQTLAPDAAEVMALRLFARLDTADIARILRQEETAVRLLLWRGLRDLQEQLGERQ
jgi:DNA-directed RNA polymerase specialized sigma24 family protein